MGSAEGGEAAKMTRGTQGGRYRKVPGRSARSERQFGCATWNSVTKKGGVLVTDEV